MDRALRILVQHHRIRLPAPTAGPPIGRDVLATLINNITAFGFALSHDAFAALRGASDEAARTWWDGAEEVLLDLSGADRKMEEFVVYKNFPREVLAMSEADYWLRQILMYWGLPNEYVTEKAEERAPLGEQPKLRVLQPASAANLAEIFAELQAQPARWTEEQAADALFLAGRLAAPLDLSVIAFKENMVRLAVHCLAQGLPARVDTATDVLRLAVGMSGGDVSLREAGKLRAFKRSERRFLLGLLERATHLEEDLARRPERFKRLIHAIHPGDFAAKHPRVVAAAGRLYTDELPPTFNAIVERQLVARDPALLVDIGQRPGELMRRLHHLILVYGEPAAHAFIGVLPRLTLMQLLKIERYLRTVNEREHRTFPPRGNWGALQVAPMRPERKIAAKIRKPLLAALASEIGARVARRVASVQLADDAALVKLPTSDSELLPYGRGTAFPLPADVKFVRTAVYWKSGPTRGNVWYDNGWNFFDAQWKSLGACCWCATSFDGKAAIFSGDPTNSKDLEGRACQMIDLYIDKLVKANVRYAVWNVLCYSHLAFDDAEEVFAALQWGVDPQKGKLFDPARCQLAFPVKGPQYTKYIAYLDLARRHVVYLDANLRANVSSAVANGARLARTMPAFVEYLNSLPSVHDVFAHVPGSPGGLPVLYSDARADLHDGEAEAYVFRPEREQSRFRSFPLMSLLA
jgi:hypothetical protein